MNYDNLHEMVDELEHADTELSKDAVRRKIAKIEGALGAVRTEYGIPDQENEP